MTIEEIEAACDRQQTLDFTRHPIEVPALTLEGIFHPLGFPTLIRTNHPAILRHAQESWGAFEKSFDTEPVRVDIHVQESALTECPSEPVYKILQPLLVWVADRENYAIADMSSGLTRVVVSQAALRHPLYLRYFFVEPAALGQISARLGTAIHGGCVALGGTGVLLCGDSGAGKSTLSYACARAGWEYIADDASYLVTAEQCRRVVGNCHTVRLRPSATALFPELAGLAVTPRAAGKPSIELHTDALPGLQPRRSACVGYIVFLNRSIAGPTQLVPFRRDVARQYLRQTLAGPPDTLAAHHMALERLLTAEIFELRYTELTPAIDRLRHLVEEGR